MKLEVGMYVRTKVGKIAKIIIKYDNSGSLHKENFVWVLDDTSILAIHSQKVVKASHNIIDLIEVGDYVNGEKVSEIDFMIDNEKIIFARNNYYHWFEEDIKSIVTKEQFESINYKIGD